jgi:hypothetical protein
VKAGAK